MIDIKYVRMMHQPLEDDRHPSLHNILDIMILSRLCFQGSDDRRMMIAVRWDLRIWCGESWKKVRGLEVVIEGVGEAEELATEMKCLSLVVVERGCIGDQ